MNKKLSILALINKREKNNTENYKSITWETIHYIYISAQINALCIIAAYTYKIVYKYNG